MSKLKLFLEKDGEKQEFEFDLSIKGALKSVKKIKQLNKEKWRLMNVEGDNPQIVAYFKTQIQAYDTDPDKFKPSTMEVVKIGVDLAKGDILRKKKKDKNC